MAPSYDEQEGLVAGEQPYAHFELQNRPKRDTPWIFVYLSFVLLSVIGGIYGIVHRNPKYSKLVSEASISDPTNCPLHSYRRLAEQAPEAGDFDITEFMRVAGVWLAISAGASLVLGLAFLWLFKSQAEKMVRVTIALQVALPLVAGIGTLLSGSIGGGLFLLGMAALSAFVFYLWRSEIELCGKLLAVSAHALSENMGLLLFAVVTNLVLLGCLAPLGAFITASYTNGGLVPNSAREGREMCVNTQGQSVPCCMWQPNTWVGPYLGLASVTLLWTTFLLFELRVFVISGTVAQWYFSPVGAAQSRKGTTLRSVRHALGPSFGSLCLGSAILTMVQLARQAAEKAREQSNNNLLVSLVTCVLECIYTVIEYLTKFATVRMAITGEAFMDAGRNVTDLLKRNFLKAYGVWWFPPMVLQMASFLVAAAWGMALYAASYLSWRERSAGTQEAGVLGVLSGLMAFVVLAFFSAVLLNIVDVVFLCYAMDRDTQSVTKADVHEVFSKVPVGIAVEQPSGDLAYGRPQHGQYVPPSHPAAMTSATSPPV